MSIKVLIVDDEVMFAEMLAKRLRSRDYQATTAADGPTALLMLDSQTPDVVVLDVRIPGMDGRETLKRIRAAHPEAKVIMLTAHGTIEDAVTDMRMGAIDYLQKPCAIADLVAAVERAVHPTPGTQ